MPDQDSREQRAARWVGETAGIAGGAALGSVLGPLGAAGGAAGGAVAGEALKTAFGEMASRALSENEARRVRDLATYAAQEIKDEIQRGRELRRDQFFDRDIDGESRSAADEAFEGVFAAARTEHEERKIPLIGKMMARFAFSPTIDRDECNFMTRLVDELSYRQICLLSLFNLGNRDAYGLRVDISSNPWEFTDEDPKIAILQEILDLYRRTMVQQKSLEHEGTDILLEVVKVAPGQIRVVQGPGGLLTRLMDLETVIPPRELLRLATILK